MSCPGIRVWFETAICSPGRLSFSPRVRRPSLKAVINSSWGIQEPKLKFLSISSIPYWLRAGELAGWTKLSLFQSQSSGLLDLKISLDKLLVLLSRVYLTSNKRLQILFKEFHSLSLSSGLVRSFTYNGLQVPLLFSRHFRRASSYLLYESQFWGLIKSEARLLFSFALATCQQDIYVCRYVGYGQRREETVITKCGLKFVTTTSEWRD